MFLSEILLILNGFQRVILIFENRKKLICAKIRRPNYQYTIKLLWMNVAKQRQICWSNVQEINRGIIFTCSKFQLKLQKSDRFKTYHLPRNLRFPKAYLVYESNHWFCKLSRCHTTLITNIFCNILLQKKLVINVVWRLESL